MNDLLIVTTFVLLDDLLTLHGHRTDLRAGASDSDAAQRAPVTVAVIAACQFGNHHERALYVLRALGYLSGPLSMSRLDRRLHALADWLTLALDLLCERFAGAATAFTFDSLPVSVCKRVARYALHKGARRAVLRLLCGKGGTVLRVALASGLHRVGGAGRI